MQPPLTPEQMWKSFKDKLHSIMEERVLSKMTMARHSHPWMNRSIKRAIRRKQRAHAKARRSGRRRDRDRYKRLQPRCNMKPEKLITNTWRRWSATATRETPRSFGIISSPPNKSYLDCRLWKMKTGFWRMIATARSISSTPNFSLSSPKKISPHYQIQDLAHIQIFLLIEVSWKGVHKLRDWNPSRLQDLIPYLSLSWKLQLTN